MEASSLNPAGKVIHSRMRSFFSVATQMEPAVIENYIGPTESQVSLRNLSDLQACAIRLQSDLSRSYD